MKQALNLTVALAVTMLWASAGPARAAGDDPLLVAPDVLIIVDTSGSMGNSVAGTTLNRQQVVREVLTGTYGSAESDKGVCNSAQKANGILDKYGGVIRFAFGTFDNVNDATYDYGPESDHLGLKAPGSAGGGLVYPVDDFNNPDELAAHSSLVQEQACQADADGSTPLSAALTDAYSMFFTETPEGGGDPTWENWKEAVGYTDPLENCRPEFVILLTDGHQTQGTTEYGSAADAAGKLKTAGITVYVVGFGDDETLRTEAEDIGAQGCPDCAFPCDENEDWCNAGDTFHCAFANDKARLFQEIDRIMADILAGTASRTQVTTQPSVGTFETMHRYYAYFEVAYGTGWKGFLFRETLGEDISTPPDGLPDPVSGETIAFHEELANRDIGANPRTIYTILSDPRSKTYTSTSNPDDAASYQLPRALDTLGPTVSDTTTLRPLMCLEGNSEDLDGDGDQDDNDIADLVETIVDFLHGKAGTPTVGGYFELQGPQLGDIFHSSPVIVPPPSVLAPDYRYQIYHERFKDRPTMLYVGANDGMLHAFVAEDNDPELGEGELGNTGKELWAFVPNYLLSKIQYVRWGHNLFVDGTPVVRDVFFRNVPTKGADGTSNLGEGITGEYRTVLISGLRGGGSAYFALDVTDPNAPEYLWEYRTNVSPASDYSTAQCEEFAPVETWAKPIVGQVWLKTSDDYISKSVAIVPGGYLPAMDLSTMTSCVDIGDILRTAMSLHVIDIETGKLLKKYNTGDAGSVDYSDIQDYYDKLADIAAGESQDNPIHILIKSDDYSKGTSGWRCDEDRITATTKSIYLPPQLIEGTYCEPVIDTDSLYKKVCCSTYHLPSGCNENSSQCYYKLEKDKVTGGVHIVIKTQGCNNVDGEDWIGEKGQGHFDFFTASDMRLETFAGTPAAYNTAFGEYLTRIFLPTTAGNIWRLDVGNGKYDTGRFSTPGEGDIITSYTATAGESSFTYEWKVGSTPWYTVPDGRPIMTEPTIALDYERNLVLFFGTGDTANLEHVENPPTESFYAVKETRTEDEGFMLPDETGTKFNDQTPMALTEPGERIYGAPLVLGGNVFFTTYVPVKDDCEPGESYTYGMTFDTFEGIFDGGAKRALAGTGTPSPPTLQWSPSGEASAVIQVKTEVKRIPVSVRSTAQILQWGKVL
jgi:hypothetical protein